MGRYNIARMSMVEHGLALTERCLARQVTVNGNNIGEFDSKPGSVSTSLGIMQEGVHTVTLESLGLAKDEWISILEVSVRGP